MPMPQNKVKAYPRKWFFIEMFTRDISLADCILDLVDNAVDGLIKNHEINLANAIIMQQEDLSEKQKQVLPKININISAKQFSVTDNCGGIDYHSAVNDVFNFGYAADFKPQAQNGQLGVYGVGLKRAIFKIGNSFEFASRKGEDEFTVKVESLSEWVKKDDTLDDWTFPIYRGKGTTHLSRDGCHLSIKRLRDEVLVALDNGTFLSDLKTAIGRTYALFMERFVRILLNGETIPPIPVPIGQSPEVVPANKVVQEDGVTIKLIASLAARDPKEHWTVEQAGWYIACNGRLVVVADRTELTGWGTGSLPAFHSKYRGFVGLALFEANDPLKLPWKTTKRGLNEENIVYQRIRNQMRAVARPVLTFLDKMYPSEPHEEMHERKVADQVKSADLLEILHSDVGSFKVQPRQSKRPKTTMRVQYDAEIEHIQKIKKHLRSPNLSAGEVGKYTFEDYLKSEGLL
jgi:hypothetical protein